MATIRLPHKFDPRPYQLDALRALDNGATRAVLVWHRRAGKDKVCLNYLAKKTSERVGAYFYFYPTYKQAKKAIWEGRDRDGFKLLDHFPPEYVVSRNETELKLKLRNGSLFQLIGTDNIDAVMSTNPIGCVFAEYSLHDPAAWDFVRPILLENGGWALFNLTPRGQNHGKTIYDLATKLQAAGDPRWFCQRLTVDDTGVITPAQIDAERRDGMDEDLIQQEYFCSFEGVQAGAYFGKQMAAAEKEGRVCAIPVEPGIAVDTWWDLGMRDAMAVWFTQDVGREVRVIDYLENSGEGLPWYAAALQERGYVYGKHHAPHDIAVRELGTGKSRMEAAAALGISFLAIPRVAEKADSIEAGRQFLEKCWFDRARTERGRLALVSYHKTWDERRKVFSSAPEHDWASNGADAFQQLAMGHRFASPAKKTTTTRRIIAGGASQAWMGG